MLVVVAGTTRAQSAVFGFRFLVTWLPMSRVSSADRQEFARLHTAGASISRIAAETGHDRKTVRHWVRVAKSNASLQDRHRSGQPQLLTVRKKAQVRRLAQ